jgi:hypothetical protein
VSRPAGAPDLDSRRKVLAGSCPLALRGRSFSFPLSMELDFFISVCLDFGLSGFFFRISGLQNFNISGFKDFPLLNFQAFKLSSFQAFGLSGSHDFKISGFQDFRQ